MNWMSLIAGFAIGVLIGGALAKWLERSRPSWSPRRRRVAAVMTLPLFLVALTVASEIYYLLRGPGTGENMQDLAMAATALVGVVFAVLALIGGLVGSAFAVPKDET
jgi:hypothetical protein